jgi:hypothetical protein
LAVGQEGKLPLSTFGYPYQTKCGWSVTKCG